MSDIVTVSIACASADEADVLARLLVEQKLAACVQTRPIRSTYRWHGEIETAEEILLTAKTLASRLPALEQAITAHHSYEVPEILAVPVIWVGDAYRTWLYDSLTE